MKYSQQEDNSKFHLLVLNILEDSITDMVGILDLKGNLIYASPSVEKVSGWKIKDLLGGPVFDKVHPDDIANVIKVFRSLVKTPKDTVYQLRIKTKSGAYIWIEASGHITKDKRTGKPTYAVVLARDITKRNELERILRESEQRYRAILDKAPDAVIIRNKHGNIVDANIQATKLFGYSKKELIGQHVSKIYSPGELKRVKRAIEKANRYGKARIDDACILKKDGQKISVDVNGSRFTVGSEVLHKIIYRDMTEQRKIQEQLKHAKVELEARIAERTMELMEANTTLKLLVSNKESEKIENEKKRLMNLRTQILPYLQELKKVKMSTKERRYIQLIEKNLQGAMSEFQTSLQPRVVKFTPKEIQVASLIKEGMSTKQVAGVMNISRKTVDIFRGNIRKKLGLKSQDTNLRYHLLAM